MIRPFGKKMCSITNCGVDAHARGFCAKHYHRWLAHGDPQKTLIPYRQDKNSFLEKIEKLQECWIWKGVILISGYGQVMFDGKKWLAHRLSYHLFKSPIPKGLCVLHKCDVRSCVNPEHLFTGTNMDNSKDMYKKGRGKHARGEDCKQSKLTESDVLLIREDNRIQRIIADEFGVSYSVICEIKSRKLWSHVS